MKTKRIWLASLLLLPLGAAVAYSQEKKAAQASSPSDDPLMMKMKEFGTPGPAHKVLDALVGKWSIKFKFTPAPGAPPMESVGTSEAKWIMDGRYVEETTEGTFGGEPLHGRGLTGYDNMKKRYVSTWIDNMGTGIMLSEGVHDAASKIFSWTGDSPDVLAGKYVKARMVSKMVDADHFIWQMFTPGPDGKEFMSGEGQYTRAK